MTMSSRACSACHSAKVKCVKVEGEMICQRCQRLGLKCVEHVSRQGQGTRRRKKVKTKAMNNNNEHDGANENENEDLTPPIMCSTTTLCSSNMMNTAPRCPTPTPVGNNIIICNGGPTTVIAPIACTSSNICNGNSNGNSNNESSRNNNGSRKKYPEQSICSGMDVLQIEDNIICGSITNGLGRDHFGLNHVIRCWVALAFSRRSFSLLARASFIATKMKIPMDDIISNQSPFAAETDSEPMDFLATDLLLTKGQRKTLGYPVDLREVPWEVLEAVQIDPNRLEESVRNRTACIRWQSQGTTRYYTSPLFDRDFATVAEIGQCWEENRDDLETVDLFLSKSEKGRFAQNLFNIIFVNNKPDMPCFVTKDRYNVQKRNDPDPIEANIIQTIKLLDLDCAIHYLEIQFLDQNPNNTHLLENNNNNRPLRANKRDHVDDYSLDDNDVEPIMGDGIEFTDIPMTDEMEEFLKLISGE